MQGCKEPGRICENAPRRANQATEKALCKLFSPRLSSCVSFTFFRFLQDEEVENRELIIPTLDEEMESYSRHSENYEDGEDLRNSQEEKSQRETQNPPKEEKKFKPLPTLEELQVLSARLKEAIAASVGAQKEAKVVP